MSLYLASGDYATYGVPASATTAQVTQASALVDSYVRRPEGLVWVADSTGAPAYMANLSPTVTLTLQEAISPGKNVTVSVLPAFSTADSIGEVFILDRATAQPGYSGTNVCEAVVVATPPAPAMMGPGIITLASVTQPHVSGAILEAGLVIQEERQLMRKRSVTRLGRTHPVRLIAGEGRFGYGRHSDVIEGTFNEVNLLATLSTFGGPPQWLPFDVMQTSVSFTTGDIWIPASMLLAYYTDVRLRYVAGFSASAIPDPIKWATARIVNNIINMPPELMGGLTRRLSAGNISIDRLTHTSPGRGAGAGNTVVDQNSMALLDAYRTRSYY